MTTPLVLALGLGLAFAQNPAATPQTQVEQNKQAGPATPKTLSAQFAHDFRGGKFDGQAFELVGPEPSRFVKHEAEGLRITLPADQGNLGHVGVATRFRARGDFEITAAFQIVDIAEPDLAAGTQLWIDMAESGGVASLGRSVRAKRGHVYTVHRGKPAAQGWLREFARHFPAEAVTGKLRLVRAGSTLSYLVAEGESNEFRLLQQQTDAGSADVSAVRLIVDCRTSTSQKPIDVRWLDLTIRAEEFPKTPAIVVSGSDKGVEILTIHDERIVARPAAIREGMLVFDTNPPREIPLDEIVRVRLRTLPSRPGRSAAAAAAKSVAAASGEAGKKGADSEEEDGAAAPPLGVVVYLEGNDRMRGQLLGFTKDTTQLRPAWGPALEIPLLRVVGLRVDSAESADVAERFGQQLQNPGTQDTVFVRDKDKAIASVAGTVQEFAEGKLRLLYEGEVRSIAQARLLAIVLAAHPPSAVSSGKASGKDAPSQVFQLDGGDQVSGSWIAIADGRLELRTAWGGQMSLPAALVRGIVFRGGKMIYLSDLEPVSVEEVPYFSRLMRYQRDANLLGEPLKMKGKAYEKALAVHSRSVLVYALGGGFERFKAVLGFDESAAGRGRVACRVLGDGKELFADGDVRADEDPVPLDLSVAGVKQLALEVDFGAAEDTGDRVIWADARVFRGAHVGR